VPRLGSYQQPRALERTPWTKTMAVLQGDIQPGVISISEQRVWSGSGSRKFHGVQRPEIARPA